MESCEWHREPSRLCIQRSFSIWIIRAWVQSNLPPPEPYDKERDISYWLPFNWRHPSLLWIAFQALLNWNMWLHECIGSSTIIIVLPLRETKSKRSKVVHVSQPKDLWQLKTIGFGFHRKTISRRKLALLLPTRHYFLKVDYCPFTPTWTRLVFSESVVESKIL